MRPSEKLYNQLSSFTAKGLELSKTMAINIIAARLLGVEEYGLLNFVIAIGAILGIIAEFRVQEISIKRIAIGHDPNKVISEALLTCLGFSTFTAAAICIAALLNTKANWLEHVAVYSIIYIVSSLKVFKFALLAKNSNNEIAKAEIISLAITALATLAAWKSDFTITDYLTIRIIDILVSCSASAYLYEKKYQFKPISARLDEIISLCKECAPLVLSGVAIILLQKIDHVMIRYFLGDYELGIYSAASNILVIFCIAPMLASQTSAPLMFATRGGASEKTQARISYIRQTLKLGLCMSAVLTCSSLYLPAFFFGERFSSASAILLISSLTPAVIALGAASSQIIIADNNTSTIFIKSLIALTSNTALNLTMIPIFGIEGAALATTTALLISNVVSNIIVKRYRYIWNLQKSAMRLGARKPS